MRRDFQDMLERRALDIAQLHVARVGGMTEIRRIAALLAFVLVCHSVWECRRSTDRTVSGRCLT
jgi:L-alanine-DL-glutamate epimerase-like enolase superfamily enzyme